MLNLAIGLEKDCKIDFFKKKPIQKKNAISKTFLI
jgi:hypothetical protein